MKPRLSNQRTHALTLVDVLVIIAVLAIVVALLLPMLAASTCNRCKKSNCVSNLKQISIAYRVWAGDNDDKYPMQVSVRNGGTMELATGRNAWINFLVMSNTLTNPKLLICPEDTKRSHATNFTTDFNNSKISYFVGLDATDTQPQMFLSGDDNFAIGDVPVKSGLLELGSNTSVAWTKERHKHAGYILLVDGSVELTVDKLLAEQLRQTGVATNRLAIP